MTKLNLTLDSYLSISYSLSDIDVIVNGKAKDIYNSDDIAGNGLDPEDVVMVISFKDGNDFSGSEATFKTTDWKISFE